MKSSFLVSVCLLPVVTVSAFTFMALPLSRHKILPPQHGRLQHTSLLDKMQTADGFSSTTTMPSNRTSTDGDIDNVDDVVAQRMLTLLEETDVNFVKKSNAEEEEFDPAKQIFDPTSFWTERSGRFPRKK